MKLWMRAIGFGMPLRPRRQVGIDYFITVDDAARVFMHVTKLISVLTSRLDAKMCLRLRSGGVIALRIGVLF